jgi:hypothetical protein
MSSTGVSDSRTGAPEVAVEDEHRSGHWPTEEDFTVTTDFLVGKEAMGAFFDPINNVLATAGPEETHANAE